ncbi:hypothetical protein RRG08_009644 [Elysia crispata]|uniref:Uncharacterized protein n=1 Tax=Elysia crispata TaxID=231223 RepID=A0AAE1DMN0_9GAST|nr:hypothetical protein RRG08_009644 [Elysia crispata]
MKHAYFLTVCFFNYLVQCMGLELYLEKNEESNSTYDVCGVLTCRDLVSVKEGRSISTFTVIKKLNSAADGEVIAGLSSNVHSIVKSTRDNRIEGFLSPGYAEIIINMFKTQDCGADFACRVRSQIRGMGVEKDMVARIKQVGNTEIEAQKHSQVVLDELASLSEQVDMMFQELTANLELKLNAIQII